MFCSSSAVVNLFVIVYLVSPTDNTNIFHVCPAALSKNRVWTYSLGKLGPNYKVCQASCHTNQIAQVK